jgi:hypothetical protein
MSTLREEYMSLVSFGAAHTAVGAVPLGGAGAGIALSAIEVAYGDDDVTHLWLLERVADDDRGRVLELVAVRACARAAQHRRRHLDDLAREETP